MKHINSTLITNNKNSNLLYENNNNIYYRTGSQVQNKKSILINKENTIRENKEKAMQKIISSNNNLMENDLKEKEIEMKNHYFLDNEKLKAILCKKRVKKNHGHKKDLKFKIKIKNIEDNELDNEIDNNRYNNMANNNDFKQLPTDINSIENNNYKVNIMNDNKSINSLKNSNNLFRKNSYYKDEKEFIKRSSIRKETFIMLPKIKMSNNS